jgi:hypothetical protein
LYTLRGRDILYCFKYVISANPSRLSLKLHRFYAEELVDLTHALAIPDPFITEHGYSFSAIEALYILLAQ